MTYIHNRLLSFLLGVLLLVGSSCASLLNTAPAKQAASKSASRPLNRKVVARSVRPAPKEAIGQVKKKAEAVKSVGLHHKLLTKKQPVANRIEVPLKVEKIWNNSKVIS